MLIQSTRWGEVGATGGQNYRLGAPPPHPSTAGGGGRGEKTAGWPPGPKAARRRADQLRASTNIGRVSPGRRVNRHTGSTTAPGGRGSRGGCAPGGGARSGSGQT